MSKVLIIDCCDDCPWCYTKPPIGGNPCGCDHPDVWTRDSFESVLVLDPDGVIPDQCPLPDEIAKPDALHAEVERLGIESEKLKERNDELESKLYTPSGKPPADLNGDDALEWLDKVVNQDWSRLKEQVKSLANENKKLRIAIDDIQEALEVEDD